MSWTSVCHWINEWLEWMNEITINRTSLKTSPSISNPASSEVMAWKSTALVITVRCSNQIRRLAQHSQALTRWTNRSQGPPARALGYIVVVVGVTSGGISGDSNSGRVVCSLVQFSCPRSQPASPCRAEYPSNGATAGTAMGEWMYRMPTVSFRQPRTV